jgi:hypothetical protein
MNKFLGLMATMALAAGCDKKVIDADDIPAGVATGELQVLLDASWTRELGHEPHLGCLFVLDPARFRDVIKAIGHVLGSDCEPA